MSNDIKKLMETLDRVAEEATDPNYDLAARLLKSFALGGMEDIEVDPEVYMEDPDITDEQKAWLAANLPEITSTPQLQQMILRKIADLIGQ